MLTDKEIVDKIEYEIIVDAYSDDEVNMGWFYTLEEGLEFPFNADAEIKKRGGGIEVKQVKIIGMYSEDDDFLSKDFLFEMELDENVLPIAYSKISNIKASEASLEVLQCWDYWVEKM
jgi:hypothetical protein